MIDEELYRAYLFFNANAGYCSPPGRAACALSLARAERWAEEEEVVFRWKQDYLPWDGDVGPVPTDVLGCEAEMPDESCGASLWGIGDPDADYRRVIQAELALELMDEHGGYLASNVLPL